MLNFPMPQQRLPRAPLARELLILNHPLLRVKGKVPELPKEKLSSNRTFLKGCFLCEETSQPQRNCSLRTRNSLNPSLHVSKNPPLLLTRLSLPPSPAFSFKSLL